MKDDLNNRSEFSTDKPCAPSGRSNEKCPSVEGLTLSSKNIQKDSHSTLEKGLLYNIGRGVDKDQIKANECFKEAITLGDKNGYLYLALNHMLGHGVERVDKVKAYSLCLLAEGCENLEMQQKLLKSLSSILTPAEVKAATQMADA